MPVSFGISPGGQSTIPQQIVDQINSAIVSGRLAEGELLPSVRGLAEMLGVHPNTVMKAYAELTRDGVLEAQGGKGVFVAERRQKYTRAERLRRVEPLLKAFLAEALILGFEPEEILGQVKHGLEVLQPRRKAARPRQKRG